jgi:hypothetical protein
MTKLKDENVKRCLELLKDFHKAVRVDGKDKSLQKKKEDAEAALNQLSQLMGVESDGPGTGGVGACTRSAQGC